MLDIISFSDYNESFAMIMSSLSFSSNAKNEEASTPISWLNLDAMASTPTSTNEAAGIGSIPISVVDAMNLVMVD